MQVLLHYTTVKAIFKYFNQDNCEITYEDQLREISRFFEKYDNYQDNLFFVICYKSKGDPIQYVIGKIKLKKDGKYIFSRVAAEIKDTIIDELGIVNINTYNRGIFYKENTINDIDGFRSKKISEFSNKIKLKYFCWEELILKNDILFEKISSIIFNEENVLNIASLYSNKHVYEDRILKKKYYSALQSIGFISKEEIDINLTVLHGDIGEFLMHYLVSEYIRVDKSSTYIYPKLAFKSNPKQPVYGNDGTIYIPEKNEIYYLEAKFYKDLNGAINKAVDSLEEHNTVLRENIEHNVDAFRNMKTKNKDEIIEITEDVSEKLILFLICDDIYEEKDVVLCLEKNNKLLNLKTKFEIIIFILPILNKQKFLKCFKQLSIVKGAQFYE
ncbi:Hachiman antiphage defense system protein HamA [Carnobacterium maltaromaticum]|uniref:Hachiman antiphage defense system protein HamA n=1 Tax=Carnobacterium maltaromaticum TaxID=2751 RepID=UPI003AFA670B